MLTRGKKRVCVTAGLAIILVLSLSVGAFGASNVKTRNLKAIFRDIQLNINGNMLQAEEEPFIIDGRTYVPLRVVSKALGASVNWDSKKNLVSITSSASQEEMENLKARLEQLENENAQLKAKIEELQGTSDTILPDTQKNLLDLTERLKSNYAEIENVKINDIRLTGNENRVNVNIDVDLDKYGRKWEVLTNNKIKSWLANMFIDIQEYYSKDTVVDGRIKDIDSKDVLVEFSKYRFQPSKVNFKDKDHRHGRGLEIYDVEDNWRGESFVIAEMRFKIASIKYNTGSNEIDIHLVATKAKASDWANADSDAARASIKEICKNIASDFVHDAARDPKVVNVRVYDRIQTGLDNFKYYVKDDVLSISSKMRF